MSSDNDSSKNKDVDWPTLESFSKLAPQPQPVGAEKRRAPRRDMEDQSVEFVVQDGSFSVVDLSSNGIGIRLEDPSDLLSFAVGAKVSGSLRLSGKLIPFRAVVKHQRVGIVGCEFIDPSNELETEVGKLLDPAYV